MNVRVVRRKSSTFHDFPYACPQRKCIHGWIVNVTPPGANHCIHRCVYCYARDAVFARPSGDVLEVYGNLPELVERDLDRISLCPPVSISNTTDPCQAVPEVRRETARLVKLLVARGVSALIVTKGDATFLLDVPGLASHRNCVVATTIEGPPEVLGLLSPDAPSFAERMASVRVLSAAGVKTAVRLDPLLPHAWEALYGPHWLDQADALMRRFAAVGCTHVICSTGRLAAVPGRGRSQASLDRLVSLVAPRGPAAAMAMRRDYVFDRSGTSVGYLLRRPARLALHRRLRSLCEAAGMTYATCQENTASETDSPGIASCEGHPLPFCAKTLGGKFVPVEGCTALCHVNCRGLERPPCGRGELVSAQPLRLSLLR